MVLPIALLVIAHTPSPTAAAILKNVKKTYASLGSYQDSVIQLTTSRDGSSRVSFKTYFTRPNSWRLDYVEPQSSGPVSSLTLWSNGGTPKIWVSSEARTETADDIHLAFGFMSMIGGRELSIIPALLALGPLADSMIGELSKLSLTPESKIGNESCYRIRGETSAATTLTIWVEKKRGLILRIEELIKTQVSGMARTVVNYQPTPNPKIPKSTFEFKPLKA